MAEKISARKRQKKTIDKVVAANINLLIVEEQPLTQSYVRFMLEDLGFARITIADNPLVAMRSVKEQAFELILCSFDFSRGKDGYLFFEELKQQNLIPSWCVFIFISAETTPEMVRSMIELDPDDFIVKPFNLISLGSRLNRALVRKQALKPVYEALDHDNFDEALTLIDGHLKNNKTTIDLPTLLRFKGEVLLKEKRYHEAEFFFAAVLKQQPFVWAQLGITKCLIAREEIDSAMTILTDLTSLPQPNLAAFDIKGALELEQNHFDDALETYKTAADISPRNVARQEIVVDLSRLAHDYSALYDARKTQLKHGKFSTYENPELYLNVARAGIDYALTIENDEEHFRLARQIGDQLREVERLPNSSRYINQLNTAKARLHYLKDERENALKMLRNVTSEEDINGAEPLLDRAKAYHELGLHAQSMEVLDKLREQVDHDNSVSPAFGTFLNQECKERDEIKYGLKELNNIAAQHFKSGNAMLAFEMFRQAMTIMPKNVRVALNLMQVICERLNMPSLTVDQQTQLNHCVALLNSSNLDVEQQARFSRLKEHMVRDEH